MSVLDNIYM